jgi:predicted transcriptional regulator of viral defense system
MLKTRDLIMYELREYASPKSKLTQMIKKGEVIQIVRGVYITSKDDPRLPVASMIYSPSYISFETALDYHQMIPERTYAIKCAGFRLNKDKRFDTPFGRYSFHYLPDAVFPLALEPAEEDGYGFRLATKEKALCDTLYKIRGIKGKKAIDDLLFEDLRFDEDDIGSLDWKLISDIVPFYHSTTLNSLISWKGDKNL